MNIHPVAKLFPMLSEPELSEMASSIRKEGLINPCVRQGDTLLDGRNRMAACDIAGVEPRFTEYDGDSPVGFIIGANLQRRHLEKGQKIALAIEIEPHFAEEAERARRKKISESRRGETVENVPPSQKSRDQAAKTVGISGKSVSQAKAIKEADPARFEKVITGKLSLAKATKEVRAEKDKRDLAVAQQSVDKAKRESIESVCDLRVCSCAELFASGIRPDAVITDPPYPKEFLSCFAELAEGCKSASVPLVAVMCGQSYLPEVMESLCRHLKYRWTLAYMTPGGQAVQQWQAKVNTSWKPVLLFGDALEWFGDVAVSKPNDNEKRFHHWGQSDSGMLDLINRLTKPGQLIADPFLGGGSTAVAALALGRTFVGCDIDATAVETTRTRIEGGSI